MRFPGGTEHDGQLSAKDLATGLTTAEARKRIWPVLFHLRGSDAYWVTLREMIESMVRVLGPPTWFFTLGPDEKNWVDQATALLRAEALAANPAMTMQELAEHVEAGLSDLDALVREEMDALNAELNGDRPARGHIRHSAAARWIKRASTRFVMQSTKQFERRIRKFQSWLLNTKHRTLGHVADVVLRIEYQDRGFPHVRGGAVRV